MTETHMTNTMWTHTCINELLSTSRVVLAFLRLYLFLQLLHLCTATKTVKTSSLQSIDSNLLSVITDQEWILSPCQWKYLSKISILKKVCHLEWQNYILWLCCVPSIISNTLSVTVNHTDTVSSLCWYSISVLYQYGKYINIPCLVVNIKLFF